jgi:hypothetical protein
VVPATFVGVDFVDKQDTGLLLDIFIFQVGTPLLSPPTFVHHPMFEETLSVDANFL